VERINIGDLIRVIQITDYRTGGGTEVSKGLVVDLVTDDDEDPGVVNILDDTGHIRRIDLSQSSQVFSYSSVGDIKRNYVYHVEILSESDETR